MMTDTAFALRWEPAKYRRDADHADVPNGGGRYMVCRVSPRKRLFDARHNGVVLSQHVRMDEAKAACERHFAAGRPQ